MALSKRDAWWALPTPFKALLQSKRQGGDFGGTGSVANGMAPYFWGQNYGNSEARIAGQSFIQDTFPRFSATRFRELIDPEGALGWA